MHHPRPNEIIGERNIWKAPAICLVSKITLIGHHHNSRKLTWAFVDKQHQLAGLGEVGLRGKQSDALESARPRPAPLLRQSSTAECRQTVADCMDLPIREVNILNCIERRHDAELSVVLQAEVAIIRDRVLPRNNEDRETLLE